MKRALKGLFLCLIMALLMPESLTAQSCLPEGITFTTQSQIDSFPILYPTCTEIEGNVVIGDMAGGSNISNLEGLNTLKVIGGYLVITDNYELSSLSGLDSLTTIGGELMICQNQPLSNFIGLGNLDSIGGDLSICGNWFLTNLIGLDSLSFIGGDIRFHNNDMLLSLSGLENVHSIGGSISLSDNNSILSLDGLNNISTIGGGIGLYINHSLNDLTGIEDLDASTIDNLMIAFNYSLSACAVTSICNYISSVNPDVEIIDNQFGCNNIEEVEDACEGIGIPEPTIDHHLSSYPNPFTTTTTIEYELTESSCVQLTIYNAIGEEVYTTEDRRMPQGKHSFTWTADQLPEGLYYAVLRSEEGVSVVKMVKQ